MVKTVIQIGLGGTVEFADLLLPSKRGWFAEIIPGIAESDWNGIFVDVHPLAFRRRRRFFTTIIHQRNLCSYRLRSVRQD